MNNHASSEHHHQQHQHPSEASFYGFSSTPHLPPTSIIHRQPATSFGSLASTASSTSTTSKRGRDDDHDRGTSFPVSHQHHQHRENSLHYQYQHDTRPSEPSLSLHPYHSTGQQPLHAQYSTATTVSSPTNDHDDLYGTSITPKKARPSNYQAPRATKPSLLSVMGTLASPSTTTGSAFFAGGVPMSSSTATFSASANTVPLRRRLSGGHLEEYIGHHDIMDTDASDNRPRSMSF